MRFKLTILILTTEKTILFCNQLIEKLRLQTSLFPGDVNVLIDSGPEKIGLKRNQLLTRATETDYVCFIDDDDMVAPDYIKTILEAIEKNPSCDCLSLRGIMTTDGENPEVFEHSLKYTEWLNKPGAPCIYEQNSVAYTQWKEENKIEFDRNTKLPILYERYPNHLNVIRSDVARQFKFLEVNHGEDHNWSTQIHKSGLLKNEVYIDKVLYHYQYRSNK